ncbi:putative nuclease HARBI1 [Lineus longissimus]|uniref:putative nuclease HARBI1 n=1 Tax=Lineus longissimus TaxID=88925 RepID=UPI00315D9979
MAANIAIFPLQPQIQAIRQYNRTFNHLERFNDKKLFKRYRFELDGIEFICDLVREDLERASGRSMALTVEIQVLLALRFFASGAFLEAIGDTLGVDKGSVSRAVRDVSAALHRRRDEFIKWPIQVEERRKVQMGFYNISGFPRVLGCIDGTHVRIICPNAPLLPVEAPPPPPPPPADDEEQLPQQAQPMPNAARPEEDPHDDDPQQPQQQGRVPNYEASFVNRKGYHSLNIQAVCDHTGKFTNIVAKWPGATHDSYIFRNSALSVHMEANNPRGEDGMMLGDSGYPCRPFLITPYPNPTTPREQHFNKSLCGTRVRIEHAFGVLKRRFHVLHGEVRMQPERVVKIVSACTVLHNIAVMRGEREPPEDESDNSDLENNDIDSDSDSDGGDDYDGPENGRLYRDYLATKYF